MITPKFKLSQDDNFLYIQIDAVLAKISDTEVHVDEDVFCFYSTPYYLKLNLPGKIIENGNETCTYADGKFSLKFSKKIPGEFFQGLDMITSLLTPKVKNNAKLPLIEVISKVDNPNCSETVSQNEEICWFVNRGAFESEKETQMNGLDGYGFANQRSLVFTNMADEFSSVIEIKSPDKYCTKMRMEQKFKNESDKFNEDHFIADYIDADKKICMICDYVPHWVQVWKEAQEKGVSYQSMIDLKPDEHYKLTILPKKEYLIDDPAILTSVYLNLVDILFAYCYDVRTNEGEISIESGWNLVKLSSVMSCLVTFIDLKEVLVSCFRRCLCYPLYRTWKLNMLVLSDLTILFKGGRLQILKCLLAIKDILQEYELNHIMNDLYIMDYCVWIQTADVKLLENLADELSKIVIKNTDCDLDLPCWEDIAIGEIEESDRMSIISAMSQLKIKQGKKVRDNHGLEVTCDDDSSSSSYFDSDDDTTDSESDSDSEDYDENDDDDALLSPCSDNEYFGEESLEEEEEENEDGEEEQREAVSVEADDIEELWEVVDEDDDDDDETQENGSV